MIFAARQIREKCRKQHQDLYMTFIDLTKDFDLVHREGYWRILENIGCPDKFVSIVRSFHDGMVGCVLDKGEISSHLEWHEAGLCTRTATVQHFLRHDAVVAFKVCDLGYAVQN